jgi:chromosome segregation ATPase
MRRHSKHPPKQILISEAELASRRLRIQALRKRVSELDHNRMEHLNEAAKIQGQVDDISKRIRLLTEEMVKTVPLMEELEEEMYVG